jgi:Arc/MetJ-type ribon-helix-helix transcriptional regulator
MSMTIKGKQILTSVGLDPEQHAFITEMAPEYGSSSAVVRAAIRLLMSESRKKETSEKCTDFAEVA